MQYSLINLTELYSHQSFRLDAEFYHPEAIKYEKRILNNFHGTTIKSVGCQVVSGPFGSSLKSEAYLKQGVPFIRISDLRDFIISTDNLIFISEQDNTRLSSSQLTFGDLILSKVGNTIGIVSKVTEKIGYCNISENNIGIKMPKSMEKEEKDFILVYLNSKPGQIQILRSISGNAQPKLNVADIELVKIPHVNEQFRNSISQCTCFSESLLEQANDFYRQAEMNLLSELGLLDWRSEHRLSFIKNYSDTEQDGRFDAEYFQPKYNQIVKAIKNCKGGWDMLGNLLNIKDKNFSPVDNKEYRYIELANIGGNGEVKGHTIAEGQELPTRARRKVRKNDVIVSSIEGSLSSIALIPEELDSALCSTGFYIVGSDKINSETLLVLLKSPVGQEQLKKGCSGTILTAINKDELGKVILPVVDKRIQSKIKQKVSESFNFRKQSKHLLECAKKAVEMAIEKNEKTATQWLKKQTQNN